MQAHQDQGFLMLLGFHQALWGWTLARQGQPEEGRTPIQEGRARMRATALAVFSPWGLTQLAEAYGQAEPPAAVQRVVAEALTVVDRTEERRWEAELSRLKGALLGAQTADSRVGAEAASHQA
jgi:hypothetical protein